KKPAAKPAAKKPAAKPAAKPTPKKSAKATPAKPVPSKPSTPPSKPKPEPVAVKSVPAAASKAEAAKPAPKSTSLSSAPVKIPPKKRLPVKRRPLFAHLNNHAPVIPSAEAREKPKKLSPTFLKAQRQRLLDLRDSLVDQMSGVARDAIRGEDGGDSSAFGMHQADAGSDSYDRDFALNILSQEQNALYEIEEALQRIETGEYGICQGSGELIPQARLEAIPFARCTVDYQEKLDQEQKIGNFRTPVTSLFGLEEKEVSKPSEDDED
ncbi:MAG: TraR/DksA C4-type zinc finger protein, partial [Verrucomicrobiae bacterium]|nr:TraR/DksA C4-type zinc finger protein [Verrucomicrobiae bacterium]